MKKFKNHNLNKCSYIFFSHLNCNRKFQGLSNLLWSNFFAYLYCGSKNYDYLNQQKKFQQQLSKKANTRSSHISKIKVNIIALKKDIRRINCWIWIEMDITLCLKPKIDNEKPVWIPANFIWKIDNNKIVILK